MAASAYLRWLSASLRADLAAPSVTAREDKAVLGYAVGYDAADLAPFVRSLRSVFSGQIILVVDRNPALLAWLSTHGVEPVIAEDRMLHWTPHPVVARFATYAQILQERPEIRRIVTTDVRDVVFQGDPFIGEPVDLQFFIEGDEKSLADHAFNMKHLTALVGERLANDLGRRACVCVGVVVGSNVAMLRFCRAVLLLCAIPRSTVGGAFGADQAACNLIAHLELVGGEICPNYSLVATIGMTPPDGPRYQDGLILNPDGTTSPIVHQYDRHAGLTAHVQGRWGLRKGALRARKTLRQRAVTLRASLLRRMPELR